MTVYNGSRFSLDSEVRLSRHKFCFAFRPSPAARVYSSKDPGNPGPCPATGLTA